MEILKDFIRLVFGMEESEEVPATAVWIVGLFLLFLVFVFTALR
jgi:hypothetical protein